MKNGFVFILLVSVSSIAFADKRQAGSGAEKIRWEVQETKRVGPVNSGGASNHNTGFGKAKEKGRNRIQM